ncbi:hypothetical protein O6H91_04G003500 [Diphasiastrum complanatum]|uniref:Uncharacterized protein n=1 Tax=Diphasiastrum complanatum TaxID=34168 RepID=A0ACC2DUH0_DIPCM|nr:hypothetical protein O6H91_04G003500 [Diphasiastrum complanatum]
MPPKLDATEGIVLNFINEQNKPLNSQIVADSLQKYGIKKTAAQKALDSLADAGKITFKEYGKQKIYLAKQDQFNIPTNEELEHMKKEISNLQENLAVESNAVNALGADIRAVETNMTMEQIRSKITTLSDEIGSMESKLIQLRGGAILVTLEEKKKVEDNYSSKITLWKKRKRIFKELWDMITEAIPRDLNELKEEVGFETDEDIGVSLQDFCNLNSKRQKR